MQSLVSVSSVMLFMKRPATYFIFLLQRVLLIEWERRLFLSVEYFLFPNFQT